MADYSFVKILLFSLSMIISHLKLIDGNGELVEPQHRGIIEFTTYNHHINNCGEKKIDPDGHGGRKCGVCGDSYEDPQPRNHENTGLYGKGKIAKTYKQGQTIKLTVKMTAVYGPINNQGFFRFSLCPLKQLREFETEECFDKYPLALSDGSMRYNLSSRIQVQSPYELKGVLPQGLVCNRCVLRWEYVAARDWGICRDGRGALGCGPQATWRTCSDIRIENRCPCRFDL